MSAAPILDQANEFNPHSYGHFFSTASYQTLQQDVIAGVTGQLMGFELMPSGTAGIFVNLGAAWQSDAHDFFAVMTFPAGNQWTFIDTSAANIFVTAGQHFVIGLQGTNANLSINSSNGDQYPGHVFFNGNQLGYGQLPPNSEPDFIFRTYVQPLDPLAISNPEPSSVLSFAAVALLGAAGWWRSRRRAP